MVESWAYLSDIIISSSSDVISALLKWQSSHPLAPTSFVKGTGVCLFDESPCLAERVEQENVSWS